LWAASIERGLVEQEGRQRGRSSTIASTSEGADGETPAIRADLTHAIEMHEGV